MSSAARSPASPSTTCRRRSPSTATCPTRASRPPIFLALSLRRPLLLEGEAGVGKTEVAKVLSRWTGGELIRLQCYEGIDASQAVYDWDYTPPAAAPARRRGDAARRRASAPERSRSQLYQERFLLKRALLRAIDTDARTAAGAADRRGRPRRRRVRGVPARGAVRLPDHRPRARACSTPTTPPVVILTSQPHPRRARRARSGAACTTGSSTRGSSARSQIVRLRVPHVIEPLARQVAAAVEAMRTLQPVQAARRRRDDRLGHGARPRSA